VPPLLTVKVPEYGVPAILAIFKVPLLDIWVVPVKTKVPGTVNVHAFVPSPIMIFEFVPETVQFAPIVGTALFLILKI